MKRFKFAIYLLSFILIFSSVSICFADETPIDIGSVEDFMHIADNPGVIYRLTADLDFAGVDYKPFAFSGTLLGNGHYINNLNAGGSTDMHLVYDANLKEYNAVCSGLFSILEGAEIRDLKIYNANVEEDGGDNSIFAGLLAGYAYNSTVSNCAIEGSVKATTAGHCFGTGGVFGFSGNTTVDHCDIDTTLICIDTDKEYKDEQFMGGVYSFGYGSITDCQIAVYGYDSDHGYVHDGGMVGCFMYYDKQHVGEVEILNSRVSGRIRFFEDNKNRRAYCEAYIGERMSWDYKWGGCTENFVRDEIKKYDEILLPEYDFGPQLVDKTDVLLISSHADDEQLFFAGLLPYYAQVRDLAVQVLYVTDHAESSGRQQERESGLYNVGITSKPDSIRYFDDAGTVNCTTTEQSLKVMSKYKITEDSFIEALHQMIMKYKPLVIVTHDIEGEYHHGMHILVNNMLQKCLEKHGAEYDFLKKVYFHLYGENAVDLAAIDEPSDKLGGKTPFNITQEYGFAAHKSQHWTWFYSWIYGKNGNVITSASQISKYSPRNFGLFYGDPSLDQNHNDLFEGLKSYKQQEQERIEEQRRLEEEQRRLEEEAKKAAEEEAVRLAEEEKRREGIKTAVIIAAACIIAAAAVIIIKKRKVNK